MTWYRAVDMITLIELLQCYVISGDNGNSYGVCNVGFYDGESAGYYIDQPIGYGRCYGYFALCGKGYIAYVR